MPSTPAPVASVAAPVAPEDATGSLPGSVRPAPFHFSAKRVPGAIVLSGLYPDEATREQVRRMVEERFFEERIVDEARLGPGAPPNFLAGVRAGLDQLSHLASGEASVTGASLRLTGEALYEETAERMRASTAKLTPKGWTVVADIRLRESADE